MLDSQVKTGTRFLLRDKQSQDKKSQLYLLVLLIYIQLSGETEIFRREEEGRSSKKGRTAETEGRREEKQKKR